MNIMDYYRGKIFCGTFTKNGNIFMAAVQDIPHHLIRLYDTENRKFRLMKSVEVHDVGYGILDTAMCPHGCHFIYSSLSENIHICSVYGKHDIHESLPLNPDRELFCVFAVRFSHDGQEILGGANDQCLYMYNRVLNKRTLKVRCHKFNVNTVAFADNTSQILFTAGDDGLCKVWDRRVLGEAHPKPVGIFAGHKDSITYIDPKGDSRHLITNSEDQTIKLWDMRAFSPRAGIKNFRKFFAVRSQHGRRPRFHFRTTSSSSEETMFGDTSLMSYVGHRVSLSLIRCRFSPQSTTCESYIYSGCSQGRIVVYDVLTGKIQTILSGHNGCVRDVSWHPYRNEIVSSDFDGIIAKWTYFGDTEEHDFNSD